MTFPTQSVLALAATLARYAAVAVSVTLAVGCRGLPGAQGARFASLDQLATTPDAAGELIYDGAVYDPQRSAQQEPVFTYQRRVRAEGSRRVSTHLTRGPDDAALLSLTATHAPNYDFVDLTQVNRQNQVVGSARMRDEHHLAFERTRAGRTRTRIERVDVPVVVGPTLFGWALEHWDALSRGEVFELRFAVIDDARTYACELREVEAQAGTTVFSFAASSALVRASVPPMRLVFDTKTRKILRYEGRVPPMLARGKRLAPLDARVEYTFVAPAYR